MSQNLSARKMSRRDFLTTAGKLGAAVAGASLLGACQPAATPTPTRVAAPPTAVPTVAPKPVTLRVRTFLDINGTTPREKALAAMVDSFQKKYPHITVAMEQLAYDQLDPKLIIENEAKTAPDVSYLSPQLIGKHAAANSLLPLDPFIAQWPKSKLDEFYARGLWDATVVNGQKLTMAIGIHTRLLYTNKDLLKKAGYPADRIPATLDEVVEMGLKLTGGGVYGLGMALGRERSTPEGYFYPLVWAMGGDILDKDGKALFNDENGVRALDWLRDLVTKHKIVAEEAISMKYTDLRQQFPQGRYGMLLDGSFCLSGFLASGCTWDNTGAGPFPSITPGKPSPMFTNSWDLGMPSSIAEEKQEAAWAFIAHFFEPENSKAYTLAEGSMPTLKSLLDDPAFKTPFHAVFADVIARAARALPVTPWIAELDELIIEAIQDVLINKTPSKQALDKAAAQYAKLSGT